MAAAGILPAASSPRSEPLAVWAGSSLRASAVTGSATASASVLRVWAGDRAASLAGGVGCEAGASVPTWPASATPRVVTRAAAARGVRVEASARITGPRIDWARITFPPFSRPEWKEMKIGAGH